MAIELRPNYVIAQSIPTQISSLEETTAASALENNQEEEAEESDAINEDAVLASTVASSKSVSNPHLIENNNLKFELENCRRSGKQVTCNLQFTNMASTDQSISIFSDCSRVITTGKEFSALTAQIGQGSSATLTSGVARPGFITFQGIAATTEQLETLEIAYDITDGSGTIKFKNIDIQGK